MNAPVKAGEMVRTVDLQDAQDVRRIEGFVAEAGASLFHRPAWLKAAEAGSGQRAAGLVAERLGVLTGWYQAGSALAAALSLKAARPCRPWPKRRKAS
jgi:hypothetical protein